MRPATVIVAIVMAVVVSFGAYMIDGMLDDLRMRKIEEGLIEAEKVKGMLPQAEQIAYCESLLSQAREGLRVGDRDLAYAAAVECWSAAGGIRDMATRHRFSADARQVWEPIAKSKQAN